MQERRTEVPNVSLLCLKYQVLRNVGITFEAHQKQVQKPFSSQELGLSPELILEVEEMSYRGHACCGHDLS